MKYLSSKYSFGSPAYFADGTAALPSITFVNDQDTGFYRSTTDTLGFTAAGTSIGTWGSSLFSITSGNVTGNTTASALALNANSLTTGTGLYAASSTLTSGKLVNLQVSGTAGATNQTALNIGMAGANATGAQTTYGLQVANTHTGTSVNVAGYFTASGGSSNYGLVVAAGNVGIGTATPTEKLRVMGIAGGSASEGIQTLVNQRDTGADIWGIRFETPNYQKAAIYGLNENGGNGLGALVFYTGDAAATNTEKARLTGTGLFGIGTASPDELLHAEQTTANTTTTVYPLRLTQISSGTPAGASGAGFGVGMEFELENAKAGGATNAVAGTLEYRWIDPTDTAEDSYCLLQTKAAGTLTRFIHNYQDPIGGGAVPLGRNTAIGLLAGNLTMGSTATNVYESSDNTLIGHSAGNAITRGYLNFLGGAYAGRLMTTGSNNMALGPNSLYTNTTGAYNTAGGSDSLYSVATTSSNTAFGYAAGYLAVGSNNVMLGNSAGRYETGTGALYIDAFNRTNTATDKVEAIIYGQMSQTVASQILTVNAAFNSWSYTAAPGLTREGQWWTEFDDTNNTMKLMFYADGTARALASVAW